MAGLLDDPFQNLVLFMASSVGNLNSLLVELKSRVVVQVSILVVVVNFEFICGLLVGDI